ncbi:MAG: hypothetical protein V4773_22360 [Verrucomicrobiota bacterium]
MTRWLLVWLGLGLLASAGCSSQAKKPKDYTTLLPRFFLEAGNDVTGLPVKLPQSGVGISVNSKPVITEGDIVGVELVQVDLGKALMFQLTGSGTRDFYRMTVSNVGRRLVLTINDAPLGARRLDGAIADGVIFVFVEAPEDELPEMVKNLKKTVVAVQEEIRRKG